MVYLSIIAHFFQKVNSFLVIPVETLAEMAVTGGGLVNRAKEIEMLDDAARSEIVAGDELGVTVDDDTGFEWLIVANGIGEMHKNFMGAAFFEIVDGNAAGHVGGRAVDFGRIFAGEGATADWDAGTVIIDDEFAASQTSVGFETALMPITGGVEMESDFGVRCGRERMLDDELLD